MGKFVNDSWIWPGLNQKEIVSFYNQTIDLAGKMGFWNESLGKLVKITGGERRMLGRLNTDIIYIPKRYVMKLYPILNLLGK